MDGVLGGYGCVNEADVRGSEVFLNSLLAERFGAEARHLVALGNPLPFGCFSLFVVIVSLAPEYLSFYGVVRVAEGTRSCVVGREERVSSKVQKSSI